MSEPKHTPTPLSETPWSVDEDGEIQDAAGNKVVDCTITTSADRDLIIRAVNAHDELLAACKAAVDGAGEYDPDELAIMDWDTVAQIRAAIAKAGGGR